MMKEFFNLLWLNLMVNIHLFWEYCRVVFKYYRNRPFLKADTSLLLSYVFINPFKISRKFLIKKGEYDVYTYGETPLTTLDHIARECGITPADTVFELGCGRGRTCLWLNLIAGCRVVGVDYVPEFIVRANRVRKKYRLNGIEFRLDDFLSVDLKGATVVYLYGTCLPDKSIVQLIERFKQLPRGTKIITVSYALGDYQSRAPFKLVKSFSAVFTWGSGEVFLQQKL